MIEEYLIKNTTRQQREQIVKDSLGYSDIGCEDVAGAYGYDMYQDYIDGIREIDEITRAFQANYIHDMERKERGGCSFQS